jgi:hypothetical protein
MKLQGKSLAERKGFELFPLNRFNVFNSLNAGEATRNADRGRTRDNCATKTVDSTR